MSEYYDDFYDHLSEYDEAVESFKQELRDAVKKEVTDELVQLRTENLELRDNLKNLDRLENEAQRKILDYEYKMSSAKHDAKREVQQEGLRELLKMLHEPRYQVITEWVHGPKCDNCDENRRLPYKTPRGVQQFEQCKCANQTRHWIVDETYVAEVTRRNGKIMIWYDGTKRLYDSDDFFRDGKVLKNPEHFTLEQIMEEPREFGFSSKETAQKIADKMNEQEAEDE